MSILHQYEFDYDVYVSYCSCDEAVILDRRGIHTSKFEYDVRKNYRSE
jgi:hypothetical protein